MCVGQTIVSCKCSWSDPVAAWDLTRVDPRNHVLDGGQDLPREGPNGIIQSSITACNEWKGSFHPQQSPCDTAFCQFFKKLVTGPPTRSVGGPVLFCLLASVVCDTPWRHNVTQQGAERDGGPVVLRPVRATPCFIYILCCGIFQCIDVCLNLSRSTFSIVLSDWMGRTSPTWPMLCQVGRKTLTQSVHIVSLFIASTCFFLAQSCIALVF